MSLLAEPLKRSPKALQCPFDRFIILANPRSSGRHQARQKIHELTVLFPKVPIVTFETAKGGVAAYVKLLEDHAAELGPRALLCIAAGDGSINYFVQALLLDAVLPASARHSPILPLWGGNGNDLAAMLNGRVTRTTTRMIFEQANVVSVQPMHFRMVRTDGTVKERVACVTASLGATAQAARSLNGHDYRRHQLHKIPGGRYLIEGLTAWWAIAASSTFVSEQTGRKKRMYEYTFGKGSRMAKWYRLPVRLNDDQFFLRAMEGKVAIITPAVLTLSFRRRFSDSELYKTTQLIVHEPVWAQFDGEPELIPAGTEIYVRLSKRPFYAFSRLLTPLQ